MFDFAKKKVGVEPGSRYLKIIDARGELIFNEPAQISFDENFRVTGIGSSVPGSGKVVRPVDYTIADFQGYEMLLRHALKGTVKSRSFLPPTYIFYIAIPTHTTEVEKRAYRDSAEHAGGAEVYMVWQSVCAAVGSNLLTEKRDFILIDMGASKTEISVFAGGQIISEGAVRLGVSRIIQVIQNHFLRVHKLVVSEDEVMGLLNTLDRDSGTPKVGYLTVPASEVETLLDTCLFLVNDELQMTLEHVSRHPSIDRVLRAGTYLTGGGTTIPSLRKRIVVAERTGFTLSNNPQLDVINGLRKVMANPNLYKGYILI
jgi:rod shape-determining protein MreB